MFMRKINERRKEMTREEALYAIRVINEHYMEAKKERISRFDVKWGMWSAEFNRGLRLQAKTEDGAGKARIAEVFNYWVLASQLLELHHKGALHKLSNKKRLAREMKKVKDNLT